MDSDDQGVSTPVAALLLIVGEPFSEEHKTEILSEITKGFRCWDVEDTGININEELAQIANRASLGIEGINGERLIQHQSDNLAVEILINPVAISVKTSIKKLLIALAPTKYIIYAGYTFQGSGAWVLQDDTFAFSNLAQVFKNVDVENALKQNIEANLTIHTLADSNWGTSISKADFTNNLRIQLNPPQKLDNIHGVLQFTAYVGGFLRVVPVTSLLQASEQFGNISFTRPTLYIFPGCQGDSALFGVNGFNLLVNGGYNRRACFWDFARHLDRLDAVLLTHLGTDNIFGLSTVLQRKGLENIHPQIGYLYFNAPEKLASVSTGDDGDTSTSKSASLIINLVEEANKLAHMAKQLGISPHPCSRSATAVTCEPVNLYHKLGHGSLDMYILNPVADSKELKEFYQLWSKQTASLDAGGPFCLPSVLSVCALLVWKPYNVDEKIVRIFFPGNAPQHKVIEGFEKMKSYGFLKLASCTTRDLNKPAPVKKPVGLKAGAPGGKSQGKAPTSARSDSSRGTNGRLESPRKETKSVTSKTEVKASSPTKPSRPIKDDSSKKSIKEREKPKTAETTKSKTVAAKEDEKETKVRREGRGASAPAPHKAASPTKSPSPPKTTSPPKSPTKTKAPAAAADKIQESKSVAAAAPADQAESAAPPVDNHVANHGVQPESDQGQVSHQDQGLPQSSVEIVISEARDAVGEVDDMTVSISSSVDKQKLEDLGIYDGQQNADYVNGKDAYEVEEEEKPQALPEPPIMLESPSLETDTMPDYSSKIESDEQELSEFSRAEEELLELENNSEKSYDPAQEIPLSPEPSQGEQQDFEYPSSPKLVPSFETPVFSNDGPDVAVGSNQPAVEQSIQYGIDDSSNGRDMGGIQEVDEDEHEDDVKNHKEALREMGIYDDDDEEDKNNEENGFEKDSNPDSEEIKKDIQYQDQEKSASEHSMSAERELENEDLQEGFDEGIEEDERASLPEACDKNSSHHEKHLDEHLTGSDFEANEDRDSLDGGLPDDGPSSPRVNGKHPCDAGLADDHQSAAVNSFIGVDSSASCAQIKNESDDEQAASFDPATQWGPPMGLPSPPVSESTGASEGRKGGVSRSNGTDKRPGTASAPQSTEARTTRRASAPPEGKKRPGTAPPAAGKGMARPGSASKRPGSAASKTGSLSVKAPPLPPVTVFYVDLTYIPNHGDSTYSDVEFFKRIRARNYVVSSLSPNPQVLDSLLEAKATWEQKDLEVTIIPTYDNEILRHWMALNKEKLQELHVDLAPAVSRCTVQLQDLETSLPAFRLEV